MQKLTLKFQALIALFCMEINVHACMKLKTLSLTLSRFHADVLRNFNEMQITFNALLGSSSLVPVMSFGGNQMYYALWE